VQSTIVIKELAGARRELRLIGSALPKQGTNWGGQQRLVTTWYPGNTASATQQVLGPMEAPTTFNGIWRTTQLYRTPAIFIPRAGTQLRMVFADGLREVLEDILRAGTLLQVYWINAEAKTFGGRAIVRIGRAKDWDFKYDRMDDIEWTINWEWTGRGLGQQKVTQFREDSTNQANMALMSAITASVDDSVNKTKIQLSKRTIPKSANKFTLEQLDMLASGPSRLMKDFSQSMNRVSNRITKMSEIVDKVNGLPNEIANQLLDIVSGAVQASNAFVTSVSQTPPDFWDTTGRLTPLTRSAAYTKGTIDAAHNVVSTSQPIAASIRAEINSRRATGANGKALPPPSQSANNAGQKAQVQVHLVKQGDTMIGISMKYYGVPEGAYGICTSNNLSLKVAVPPVGKVLIIPPLTTFSLPTNRVQLPVPPAGGPVTLPNGVGQQPGSP